MNITSLILRILAVVGAIAAAVLFFMIEGQKEEIENELTQTRTTLEQTRGNLSEMTEDRDAERTRADNLQNELDQANRRISQLEIRLRETQEELRTSENNLREARREIASLESERDRVQTQLSEAQREIEDIQNTHARRITELQNRVSQLQDDLEAAEEGGVGIPDDLFADGDLFGGEDVAPPEPAPVGPIRGMIGSVGPESSFVILDLGSADGIRDNARLMILRGDEAIGQAVVSRVQDNAAVAQVQPGTLRQSIRTGDSFRTLN